MKRCFSVRMAYLGRLRKKYGAAYFLKVIGPVSRNDISLFREIRNQAAHDMNPISFDGTSEISSRCRALQSADTPFQTEKPPPICGGDFLLRRPCDQFNDEVR